MEVVAEKLDVTDGGSGNLGMGEMTRKENKSNVTNVFRVDESGDVTDFQRGFPSCVEHLRGALNCWKTSGIDEFLRNH